ncbi:alcohol dehydrogenase [acceptor]-like isoform X2 [Mytilus trossulus]|uniref:alcohol dehydrogenase [acceptor]-like isoform X2 n=1 Tax=Mytilus trossulus TaxID=6551 RepID=UPI0030052291
MDKIPNRDPVEPDYPDYQMSLYTVAQDEGFLDYGLDVNIKPEVTKLFKTRAKSNEFTNTLIGLHPKSKGTIRLQSTDPFDPPLIDPHYLENPYDIKVMIAVSTCRMGTVTDPSAVVDPELRVKGILNLRVADASVMRNEPSGNTNAPCIMIGEKAADLILGKDTVVDFRKQIAKLKL